MGNPFRPGFGQHPTIVVGRQTLAATISAAFDADWSPYRKTYFRAPRGTGKTVMLDVVQDAAVERGWLVVEDNAGTASPALIERLQQPLRAFVADRQPPAKGGTTAAINVGPMSASHTWETPPVGPGRSLRDDLEAVLQLADASPAGVLLSIDEIHDATHDEIATLANAVQHLERANLPIALVIAGLPTSQEAAGMPTFLARCQQPDLAGITADEIARGFRDTAAVAGRVFAPDALAAAVAVAGGLPYMMQMVGWYACEHADPQTNVIRLADVEASVPDAARQLAQAVIGPATRRLSPTDMQFLAAMAIDDGPSAIGRIADRMGRNSQYVNVYRTRLLNAGVVHQVAHGLLDFALPGYRAYLRTLDVGGTQPGEVTGGG